MMKIYAKKLLLLSVAAMMYAISATAQTGTLTGKVTDNKGETIPGASVVVEGTTQGAVTDIDGNFSITNLSAGEKTFTVSSIGFITAKQKATIADGQTTTLNFKLSSGTVNLNEAVVIGYGTARKKDLTGSVTSINSKDFNLGATTTPEQLVSGKIAGVNITSNGGAPGSGSRIRIRGASSLNASNDPLIVIDGVPVDNGTISGSPNPLSLINPNDIENITVLKDASATAIYGNRAAGGVILITTKRGTGSKKISVDFSTTASYSKITDYIDILSADEFRAFISDTTKSTATQRSLLGTANTDWQKEVFRDAFGIDNNIAISGGIQKLPYRLSLGYSTQQGILDRSTFDRGTIGINLSPSFLKDQLKVDVSAKLSQSKSFFPDAGAIGAATSFDPTQNIRGDTTAYGGYFEWLDNAGKPITVATRNPVGLLEQREDESTVNRLTGNVKIDYAIPYVKGLRSILVLGTDRSHGEGDVFVDSTAAVDFIRPGRKRNYEQDKTNELLDFYFNYVKELPKIKSRIDATAGYSYQSFLTESPIALDLKASGDTMAEDKGKIKFIFPEYLDNFLISFYGRINYSFRDRYLLTLTLRNDNTSRYSKEERSGYFPSAAFAWRVIEESFLKDSKCFSDLKLRLGYGEVGQQDGIGNYAYIANYFQGTGTAQYQFGNNYYPVYRPAGYEANLTWEKTRNYNIGLDFGFLKNRIYGSIDVYKRETFDLLAIVPVVAGTNFTDKVLTNVGDLENNGAELSLNFIPVSKEDMVWEVGVNFAYNETEITNLNKTASDTNDIFVGGISGGVGANIQIHSVGYTPFSFYVFEHIMDGDGNPRQDGVDYNGDGKKDLLDMYIDQNGDSIINDRDKVRFKKPEANFTMGFNTSFRYKNWTLSTALRGSFGNYMYNNVVSLRDNLDAIGGSVPQLNNISPVYFDHQFKTPQYYSDIHIEKASFVKMDYLSLAYNFSPLLKNKFGLSASFTIQNVLTITDYSGLDPEVAGGIDNSVYPRPRIYSLGINFRF